MRGTTLQELRDKRRDAVLGLASRHGAYNVRVFGSVARADGDEQSDVDFLVDPEPGRSLTELGGLLMDLQEALGAPVDVVREKGLRSQVRARVLAEAVPLCETTAPGFRNRARKLFDGRSSRRRLFARARERSRYGQSGHARKRISFPF